MIISFEGIDGSGKSTQIKRLLTRLDLLGKETLYVREPWGYGYVRAGKGYFAGSQPRYSPFCRNAFVFCRARSTG